MRVTVTTTYKFISLSEEQVREIKSQLEQFASERDFRGLVILGREGINLTASGPEEAVAAFKTFLGEIFKTDVTFKDSPAEKHPFHHFSVKVRPEIVTLKRKDLLPPERNNHLPPEIWHEWVKDPNVVVLDTRNEYEVEIGKFRTAKHLPIDEFHEFPKRLEEAGIPKDKKVLIYCTGGIRCEKASLAMAEQGYKEVYQLDGGILNYLKHFPNGEFEGECFVFDYRVAVDQYLKPTRRFKLCPHCGQPAREQISCRQCGDEAIVCASCKNEGIQTCSKNCQHHFRIGSRSKKRQLSQYHSPMKAH